MTEPATDKPTRLTLEHPQPVGFFELPAGYLLTPGGESTRAARETLLTGRLPEHWPDELAGHHRVYAGEHGPAERIFPGTDAISRYNRWVLDPDGVELDSVRAGLPQSARALVDIVQFCLGRSDAAPTEPPAGTAPEVAALFHAARAAAEIEAGLDTEAGKTLLTGADLAQQASPVLAAVLRGNAAGLLHEQGELLGAEEQLEQALAGLQDTELNQVRAELWLHRGSMAQELAADGGDTRALLQHAMSYYYTGLQLVTEQSAPFIWASLNMNLATAHLSSPMTEATDQLRLGVAAQSLRACRRVFDPDSYPEQWSSATLNLANALVYTPSTHQQDNLVEAVELYEEVLRSGAREHDRLGRARVLANQGNALAHLGEFGHARAKLVEARFVFEEHLDHDSAMAVRSVLDEIAREQVDDPDPDLTDLARQAEQMARMPQSESVFTSGMNVAMTAPDAAPPRKPTVVVLDPATRPTAAPGEAGGAGA